MLGVLGEERRESLKALFVMFFFFFVVGFLFPLLRPIHCSVFFFFLMARTGVED